MWEMGIGWLDRDGNGWLVDDNDGQCDVMMMGKKRRQNMTRKRGTGDYIAPFQCVVAILVWP